MPGKKALLCGAVLPLACVSLGLQPAMAAMPKPQAMAVRSDVVRVQQEEPEELLRKRLQQGEEQPAPPAEEAPPRPEPAPQPEPERPAPEVQPEAAPAERERQPEEPRREQERPRAAEPSAPTEERAPEAGQQRRQREEQPAPPAGEAPPRPEPAPQAEPERPAPQPEAAPAESERQPEPRRERERPRAAEERAPEAVPEPRPAPQPAPESVPVPEQSPAPQQAPVPEGQTDPRPGRQPADGTPAGGGAPARPAAPESAPRQEGAAPEAPAGQPVPPQAAAPQQEAPPMTPEQLERARAIADNPAATNETVVLPVDRGAAVLDSDKEAEGAARPDQREERRRQRQEAGEARVPQSDAEAQQAPREGQPQAPVKIEPATSERGERLDRRPEFERPEGVRERRAEQGSRSDGGARIILEFGDRTVVRGDDRDRFVRDGDGETYYERLPGGRVREVVERRDGTQVVTITDRYGDVIQRSRIDGRGREYVLFYAPDLRDAPDRRVFRDPGLDLPPMRLGVPLRDYIIDTSSEPDRDYYRFLAQPPVERVERVYSLDEVRYSARIRDKARRIDLDTLTFATGSADIPMNQARTLRRVADAMNRLLDDNPAESFLIEGHTDAVGSDESNLILSDERAASVANVLTDVYGIPPENMVTQGYGERYLKVKTPAAEQANRRVTIRRVTALVKPVAAN